MSLAKTISHAIRFALDTIAPPDPKIREIELLTAEEFGARLPSDARIVREDGVRAFFPYRTEILRNALVELKTFENRKVVRLIGAVTREPLIKEARTFARADAADYPLLIPIPMTRKGRRARGWNQCELIAREICGVDGEKTFEMRTDVLFKIRETADQVGKTRDERFENLKSCFSVREGCDIRGRDAIVIDDIVTTGATLGEAKRALLLAGARAVICVAVAY